MKSTPTQRIVLLISILASVVSVLDGFIVNVALPAITKDLHGGLTLQQWVVDAYLITLGSLMLVAGSLSDLFGRKKVLQIGLMIFLGASLLCAASPSGLWLILARAVQGVGGALLVPSSLALIISAFSGSAQGKAIGSWTAWTGIAVLIGPLVGGVLIDTFSWQSIFLVNILPVAVTMWLLSKLRLPEEVRSGAHLDIRGAIMGAVGLGGTVYACIEQGRYGWSSPLIYVPLVIGILALLAFIRYERRIPQPMLPMGLFKARNFSVGNVATIFIYAALALSSFLITIFVQQYAGYSALKAGMVTMPITLIMFVLSPRFGNLAGKYGPRWFMGVGPIVAGLGLGLLLRTHDPIAYWTQFFPALLIFGLGLATTVAPLTSAILGCISPKQAGIASAINNAVSRIAGLLGVATIGVITGVGSLTLADFHHGMLLVALLLIAGGTVSAIGIQNNPQPLTEQPK